MSIQLVKKSSLYDVIVRQVNTDKSHKFAGEAGLNYVFIVDVKADKALIKTAIEQLFNVKVKSVNTQIRYVLSNSFRGKRSSSKIKIAYVQLESGSISYDI